jgi:hypothetical protein
MKAVVNRALRRAVVLAQESGLFSGVKPFFKSVLLEGTLPLSSVVSNMSFAGFIDEKCNEFKLVEGLRDAVKPGWQWVLHPDKDELPNEREALAGLHVLLGSRDFERYLARFRPAEVERAMNFYRGSLNRMTIGDIERHSTEAGLKTLAFIPFTEKAHAEFLAASVFRIARENYPTLTIQDLSAPFVPVVQAKL